MARIVIIGAGLTGLTAAYYLEQNGITDYVIFEKEASPGGLCRSVRSKGFTFDYTGHLLHINNRIFHQLLKDLFGSAGLVEHIRNAAIYSHQRYTGYPYQRNLYGLPASVITDCIEGFANRTTTYNISDYKSWVFHHFGTGFASHFFFPYQQKLFDYPLDQITSRWTDRFVPTTSLRTIIEGALIESQQKSVGYNALFSYPQAGGIDRLIAALIQKLSQPIRYNQPIHYIDDDRKILSTTNGHHEHYEQIITTMPLDQLLTTLHGTATEPLHAAAKKLRCTSVINITLGTTKSLPDYHWIYYPEDAYPFYRIGFPHKLGSTMAPKNCSSLSIEIAHHYRGSAWQQATIASAIKTVQKLFDIADHQVLTQTIQHLPYAYVLYDQWRDAHVPQIRKTLAKRDIFSTGRYGSWQYNSMQEAVLSGKQIAEQLVQVGATHKNVTSPTQKKNIHENV